MENFLDKLIKELIKCSLVPTFQNERAFSPILSIYLENIINLYMEKEDINESYIFVTNELPISENGDHYIDYLLHDKDKNIALLVELKAVHKIIPNTDCQIERYEVLKNNNNLKDVIPKTLLRKPIKFKKIPSRREKQNNELRKRLFGKVDNINEIKIMYIAPDSFINELSSKIFIDYRIGFKELADMEKYMDKKTACIWKMISKYIKVLN
jgi:hypothetical protein